MTINNCGLPMRCFFLLVLSTGMLRADDATPEAKQLLQSAHQASDPSAILPYELHGTVIINPGTENEKKGHLTIYRDHERSRTELRIEDYLEVKLTLSNKLYIARSTPFPVPLLGRLAETDHYWDRLAEDGDAKLSDVSKKKVQNQVTNCFDVKSEQRHRLCFDPARKVLLENLDHQKAVEFSNYNEVDQFLFPGKITVLLELEKQEKPVLVIGDIEVRRAQFAATAFSIPPRSVEFDTCENMQPAKPLRTPPPEFSTVVMRRNAGTPPVNVYGIIGKDGDLQNVKILSPDPEVQQTIMEATKKWRYSPAMCGTSPVATEKEIQVPIGGMGDGDAGGARRGR